MPDYEKLKATAARLIKDSGRSVSFIAFDETVDDASTPWKNSTPRTGGTSVSLNAVFVPPTSLQELGANVQVQRLALTVEQILIVEPGTNDLKDYKEIDDGGTRYSIEFIEILKPGDTVLLAYVGVKT